MGRPEYLALVWPPASSSAGRRVNDLAHRVDAEGFWRPAGETDRMRLWIGPGGGRIDRLADAGGFLVGDVFASLSDPTAATRGAAPAGSATPLDVARRLARDHWGRYVAFLQHPGDDGTSVFRDPTGDLDCQTWPLGAGVSVVASDMRLAPAGLRPPRLSLNWDRIAAFVAAHNAVGAELLFDGAAAVAPGTLRRLPDGPAVAVWSPAAFVATAAPDEAALRAELVRRVDSAVAALSADYPRLIAEVSGGLDSAIVAAALAQTGRAPRVVQWLNRRGDRPEGDERGHARAVTERLGVALTTVVKSPAPLIEADIAELGSTVWPAINGIDAARDRDMVERLRSTGAGAMVSGQGGDAVFFQMPSALVAADEVRRRGLGALASPLLVEVARRTRTSVWQVLAEAWPRRGPSVQPTQISPLVSQEVRMGMAGVVHPWARDAAGLSPAKQLQIRAIANAHIYRGDCRRRRVADLIFPLLAQPVVELCLSIPAAVLAGGAHDRRFARAAFADRLPACVRQRRSKGDLTAYFAHLVAASLPTLRPWLLEGCLCEAGVLDRAIVDRALTPQALITAPAASELLCAAAAEAWVRRWQGRVPDGAEAPRSRRAA
jgi:asparagine synthase (glutamine-hydrolysing)